MSISGIPHRNLGGTLPASLARRIYNPALDSRGFRGELFARPRGQVWLSGPFRQAATLVHDSFKSERRVPRFRLLEQRS
jgi:hypothetical protein